MNLNRYNLKNTLNTEHLKESRTYAGIQEWVELLLIIKAKKVIEWLSQKKIQPISRSGFTLKPEVSLKATWLKNLASIQVSIHLRHKYIAGNASFC